MEISDYQKRYADTLAYLQTKKCILFLTTSNRHGGWPTSEVPKSTQLALKLAEKLGDKVTVIDVTKLNIEPCHGNVSTAKGNVCGLPEAVLEDKTKNPTGQHRCRINHFNADDELWKISKVLFECDTVVFFTSVRRGQTNSFYQKLIERLNWIENRHTTLGESSLIEHVDAGIIITGHNRNGELVLDTQKKVLGYYGFQIPNELSRNRFFTTNPDDESKEWYKKAVEVFHETFG